MPFESQWARIPLGVRWGISLLIGVAIVVAIIVFVNHNNNNSLAHVSAKNVARETQQADVLIGQDQAPRIVQMSGAGAGAAMAALEAGIRQNMRHRIARGNVDGPLGSVRCGRAGARDGRIAYHCLAEADHVRYPFMAVATPRTRRAVFCKKDFPPIPSENIPVSSRCRL